MSILEAAAKSGKIAGAFTAVVSNNQDPMKLGRVKVKMDWIGEDQESNWARLVRCMGGKGMGMFFLPDVGDEVLIAFEQGDIGRPFVLGMLWNEEDRPPSIGKVFCADPSKASAATYEQNADGRNTKRFIMSKKGNLLCFSENDAGVTAADGTGGQRFELKTSEGAIKITSKEGDVEIHAPKGKLALNGSSVSISGSSSVKIGAMGKLTINGTTGVKIDAGGDLKIKASTDALVLSGGMVNFEGATYECKAAGSLVLTGFGMMSHKGGGPVLVKGAPVNINAGGGPGAGASPSIDDIVDAVAACEADAKEKEAEAAKKKEEEAQAKKEGEGAAGQQQSGAPSQQQSGAPSDGGRGGAPSGGAPSGGAPSGGAPSGGAPSGGAPSGGAPSGGAPSGGAPSGGAPSGGAPSGGAPSGGAPSGGAPSGGAPSGGAPSGGAPSGGAPSGATPQQQDGPPAGATPQTQQPPVPAGPSQASKPPPPAIPNHAAPSQKENTPFAQGAGIYWPVRTSNRNGRKVALSGGRGFLAKRSGGARYHVGIDCWGDHHDEVVACEDGVIVNFYHFYRSTYALLVECDSGIVINYSEVMADSLSKAGLSKGSRVRAGQTIGTVGKMNVSSMCHFETYTKGTKSNKRWMVGSSRPSELLDPTQYLVNLAKNGK